MLNFFMYPIFLFAGAAALVPLVLHLIQRLRMVRFPFSTIRFLAMARKKAARRSKLENLLLLFLRVFLMLLIAAAFAMPIIHAKAFSAFLSQKDRDIAVVLDASYSMTYGTESDSAWTRALGVAEALLNKMGSRDRVCIFLAQDQPQPILEQLSPNREFALSQMKALKPAPASSRLLPAIRAASRAFDGASGRREKEIHVITDGQALPWTDVPGSSLETAEPSNTTGKAAHSGPGAGSAPAPVSVNRDIPLFVTLTGVPAPENAGIRDIEIAPPLITPGGSCKLTVNLVRTGPTRDCPVSVYVDNEEAGRRAADDPASEAGAVTFVLHPMAPGVHQARAEISPDNLSADNVFHFLLRVQNKTSCLCVGSEQATFYLMKALSAGMQADAPMILKRIEAAALAGHDVFQYACVFLCDALPLPGQTIVQLEHYVEAGGLLALFPGDSASVQDYQAWRCLPAFPAAVEDIPVTMRNRVLRWEDPPYAAFKTLKMEPDAAPVVAILRQLRWKKMEQDAGIVVSAGAGNPFLLRRVFGKGETLAFSVSADRSWAGFPLSPYYLPILHQIVRYGAGMGGSSPFIWPARAFSLSDYSATVTQEDAFLDPAGNPMPIRSLSVSNRATLCVENLLKPGVYSLVRPDTGRRDPAVAVNMRRIESDLTPVTRADLAGMLGKKDIFVTGGKDELMRLLEEQRQGRTFGEQLLWLALIVALFEVVYANWRAKSSGTFSAGLDIGPAGKVTRTE